MVTPGPGVLDRVRQPEYTGENRCVPCTAVNVLIGAVVASGLWLVDPLLGAAFVLLGFGAIWLRGYLVPGTPTLTKRYLPDRVLRWFDKGPVEGPGGFGSVGGSEGAARDGSSTVGPGGAGGAEAVDVERYLLDVGAVEPAGNDLAATPDFREAWQSAIAEADADPAGLAGKFLDLDEPGVEERHSTYALTDGGFTAGEWPSRAALLADVGAIPALRDRDPKWAERDSTEQGRILGGLRLFCENCPECGGTPELGEETVESCCREAQVYTYTCGDCGARLLEIEQ